MSQSYQVLAFSDSSYCSSSLTELLLGMKTMALFCP